ncbi:MAG: VWA domain-containing protein [Gemmataceae bacterium]
MAAALPLLLALATLPDWLPGGWPALAAVVVAGGALAASVLARRRLVTAAVLWWSGLALLAGTVGGLLLDPAGWLAWPLLLGGAAGFAALAVLLLLTGYWSPPLALAIVAAGLLGLGGVGFTATTTTAAEFARSLADLRLKEPWWLLLLALVPAVVALSWRRLGRDELRPWLALGLRATGVTLLAVALAEPFFSQSSHDMTVLFVVDRSLSVPEEMGDDPAVPGGKTDLRTRRILRFLNEAVAQRGAGHERDRAGLIVFGRQPRLELPPSDVPRFDLRELPPADDGDRTDLAAALKLALASFPEGGGRRIVLLSDGNENQGDAEEQARLAKTLGVQIDVVPLAATRRQTEEVLVERVEAPPVIERGARLPIRVLVRSHHPQIVVGRLTLRQITDKEGSITLRLDRDGGLGLQTEPIEGDGRGSADRPRDTAARRPIAPGWRWARRCGRSTAPDVQGVGGLEVLLARQGRGSGAAERAAQPVKIVAVRDGVRPALGLNAFSFDRPLSDEQRSYTYEAEFQPLAVEDETGRVVQRGLPGDRVQNNRASTHVVARGQGRILLLEGLAGGSPRAGRATRRGRPRPVPGRRRAGRAARRLQGRDKLTVFLSNFDLVVLANVPAERVSEEHQEVLRSNTHDQGCGLVMIGGREGFGAGGWQNTAVEKALPVDCQLKSTQVQGKGGLVLVMHASEMARGNYWQKRIAKLAVERLGPADEVGVIDYDFRCKWHVPMQEVGPNRAAILAKIDRMTPGDMPDFDPALEMAHVALTDRARELTARHIIVISDGDPLQTNKVLLRKIKADRITIATVGVATHGAPEDDKMREMASTPRRYYKVDDPKQLPAIYIKETRLVSQAFVYPRPFTPRLVYRSGPTARLPELLPLGGFVRTTPKESPLVETPIVTPVLGDREFPILSYWNYGLGKAVAFTSDAGGPDFWARRWLAGGDGREGIFAGFWEQVLGWAVRPVESGRLAMTTEYRDGRVRVVVEARTPDGKPDTGLRLRGGLTPPAGRGDGKARAAASSRRRAGSTRRRCAPTRPGRTSSPPRRRACARCSGRAIRRRARWRRRPTASAAG